MSLLESVKTHIFLLVITNKYKEGTLQLRSDGLWCSGEKVYIDDTITDQITQRQLRDIESDIDDNFADYFVEFMGKLGRLSIVNDGLYLNNIYLPMAYVDLQRHLPNIRKSI